MQTNINPSNLYSDVESEAQVIQAIYIKPDALFETNLTPKDFTSSEYRNIFEAMIELYSSDTLFDYKAIHDLKPMLNKARLFNLLSEAFTAANIKYHSGIVQGCSFNRKCRDIANALVENVGSETFMEDAEMALTQLYEHYHGESFKDLEEIFRDIESNIKEARKSSHFGVQTGFNKLDEAVVGMCPRHFWVLGAYTSYGKSTLLSQIIDNVCPDSPMLVFSVEDSKEDKLTRLLATKTGIPIKYIVKGEADENKIRQAREVIEAYPLTIYDDVYTLEGMELKIKKHKLKNKNLGVVAIDFIQNIQTKSLKIYDRMSEVAIGLQKIAKKHAVCILALSQVSENKEKGSISLRGAQEIASAADIVLWIEREKDCKDFKLIIRKNRPFGETGFVNMTFTENWTGMKEGFSYE